MTIIRPLFTRAHAFHEDPAWDQAAVRARKAQEHAGERMLTVLLDAARAGEVARTAEIIPFMHRFDDDSFWGRASVLLSYAAPGHVLKELLDSFSEEIFVKRDVVVQCFVAETLLNSGLLWTVPDALRIMLAQTDRETMFSIPMCLSTLLESSPGPVSEGPDRIVESGPWPDWFDAPFVHDDQTYAELVGNLYRERLTQSDRGGDILLFKGDPFDIPDQVSRLYDNLGRLPDDGDVTRCRTLIEAATGFDLSAFYSPELVLDRLAAAAALERLSDEIDLTAFIPGRRYFFGRPV